MNVYVVTECSYGGPMSTSFTVFSTLELANAYAATSSKETNVEVLRVDDNDSQAYVSAW